MVTLSHSTEQLDRVLNGLSNSTRRRLWAELGRRPGATTVELCAAIPLLSRWAVIKHLAALREAGLIQTLPEGRHRRHFRDVRALGPLREWLDGDR